MTSIATGKYPKYGLLPDMGSQSKNRMKNAFLNHIVIITDNNYDMK